MPKSYDEDFYGWANEQAALLRAGQLALADIGNIAEEIESMGKGEKRELVNRLIVLLQHLLKWEHQPAMRTKSWRTTIRVQRDQIAGHMADNPSLKSKLGQAMADAYRVARLQAGDETELAEAGFPSTCPFSYKTAMDDNFWPGP